MKSPPTNVHSLHDFGYYSPILPHMECTLQDLIITVEYIDYEYSHILNPYNNASTYCYTVHFYGDVGDACIYSHIDYPDRFLNHLYGTSWSICYLFRKEPLPHFPSIPRLDEVKTGRDLIILMRNLRNTYV